MLVGVLVGLPLLGGPPSADADPGVTPGNAAVWPLRPVPEVVAEFDPPGSAWGRGHRGVDLLGRAGQQVLSALPGRVTYAGPLAGRGVVVVDHGATRTTYEPVVASVRVGRLVAAGEEIGRLESFGSHCRPRACLHWGLLEGSVYLDPLTLVGSTTVRLWPIGAPVGRPRAPGWWASAAPLARPTWPGLGSPATQALGCACW